MRLTKADKKKQAYQRMYLQMLSFIYRLVAEVRPPVDEEVGYQLQQIIEHTTDKLAELIDLTGGYSTAHDNADLTVSDCWDLMRNDPTERDILKISQRLWDDIKDLQRYFEEESGKKLFDFGGDR